MPSVTDRNTGAVYPLSVSEGIQSGSSFELKGGKVFRHLCGFAYADGEPETAFLEEIYSRFLSPEAPRGKRFLLFVTDVRSKDFFAEKKDLIIGTRYFFRFGGRKLPRRPLPEGMRLCEIDSQLCSRLPGRITPQFSWEDAAQFTSRGKGFCIMDGRTPAAWAFSAAVSSDEIDIGVETAPGFRRRGLAALAAEEMIRFSLGSGKHPVWACSSENEGSRRLAEKLGFVKCGECFTVTVKQDQHQ